MVGELACGNLQKRQEILDLLAALPEARLAEHNEVLHLLDSARLHGRGLGWIDAHLLACYAISTAFASSSSARSMLKAPHTQGRARYSAACRRVSLPSLTQSIIFRA